MAVWQFVVVYLVVFGLLQFAVYRYLRRGDDGSPAGAGRATGTEGPPREGRPTDGPGVDAPAEPAATDRSRSNDPDDDPVRLCPNCGARNERTQVYSYCQRCASPLRG